MTHRVIITGALIAILTGCSAGGVNGAGDSDSGVQAACPAQVDPIPCLRRGDALAGGARWLIQTLDDGADATAVAQAIDSIDQRAAAYEACSAETAGLYAR